jgi:hypothetical protein
MFDKEKILRLCDEIENALSDAWNSGAIEYELAGHIVSFAKKIAAEITAPPKSNADRIRQMTDEELAEWLLGEANYSCNICIRQNEKSSCYDYSCEECVAKWLKQEVSEDANQ